MSATILPLIVSLTFLAVVFGLVRWIIKENRKKTPALEPESMQDAQNKKLDASDILKLEFDYAQTTAGEAMRDRHTMINFYLLTVGIVTSGVLAILQQELPGLLGTLLLWVLCLVGWLYLLKIVRLRLAWIESAKTMNLIKDFYLTHSEHFGADELSKAFRWRIHTVPPADQPWTLFYYSACLIAILNSIAFTSGAILLGGVFSDTPSFIIGGIMVSLGVVFFLFHMQSYKALFN